MKMDRRQLLKVAGSAVVGSASGGAFAGSFTSDATSMVPGDKQFSDQWIGSLTERGNADVIRFRPDLTYVGMPVGGCFAGTVYLGANGRLWNWDILNAHHLGTVDRPNVTFWGASLRMIDGANYMEPPGQEAPFWVDFAIDGRAIDDRSFGAIDFRGEYPVGRVLFGDGEDGWEVELEAYSPFVPLQIERSSWPAVVMEYRIKNLEGRARTFEFSGRVDHPSGLIGELTATCDMTMEPVKAGAWNGLVAESQLKRVEVLTEDVIVSDWEDGTFGGWVPTGTAFGTRPRRLSEIARYQGELGAKGEWVVNSHQSISGETVNEADAHTGTLTSPEFLVERRYLSFLIGGGRHPGQTGLEVWIDNQKVGEATGHDSNQMRRALLDLGAFRGKTARVVLRDEATEGWGHIGVDDIRLTDSALKSDDVLRHRAYGSFCLLIEGGTSKGVKKEARDTGLHQVQVTSETAVSEFSIPAGGEIRVRAIVAWHYPSLQIPNFAGKRRWYSSRWKDAATVARELSAEIDELSDLTKRWRNTWYDSTLPYWFLDRTFVNTSILATNTCHRFADGRYWFWEGVGCCHGTCTHVWSYAQAVGRVFPDVERRLREEVDFGLAFREETGAIDYRAEFGPSVAIDGKCGCVLRAYREHLTSKDNAYLARVWPKVKKAMEYVIREDKDRNGVLEGEQYNTLDASWYGEMAWISSMYIAALKACHEMAVVMGNGAFGKVCLELAEKGSKRLVSHLYNGEYFIHKPDPAHPEANATGEGCHIDQLYGQSWAHQVGLGRVVPAKEARSAMAAMFKYSFVPDVGAYRRQMREIKGGRWYAAPGEAGLLMTTFPKGGADRATGKGRDEWAAAYFNECMTGFEYQAASHMVWEGLVTEGLVVTRAIHDRYSADKRNPYNEIECSDHYGRAMASYGVFLTV